MGVNVSRKSRTVLAVLLAALVTLIVVAAPSAMAKSSSSPHALRFKVVKRTLRYDVVKGHSHRFAVKRRAREVNVHGLGRCRVVRRTRKFVALRTFKRSLAPSPTVTSPNSGSFVEGSTASIAWKISSAVSTGSFRVSLENIATSSTTSLTASDVSANRRMTAYSMKWNVSQALGSYRVRVDYCDSSGSVLSTGVSSGIVSIASLGTVTPTPTPTVTPMPTPAVTPMPTPTPTVTPPSGDVLNVKDYGAKGDGLSNDYAALGKAFAAAATTGTTVYLPAGTYLVNSRLTVPANVSITGDGSGSWLDGPVSVGGNSTWSNLRIGAVGHAVYLGGVSGVTFNGVRFTGGGGAYEASYPIYDCHVFTVRASSNVSFTNCTFDGNPGVENSAHSLHFDVGFVYAGSHDISFSGCAFGASPRFGVEMWDDSNPGGYNISYSGCTFAHTSDATLDFSSYYGDDCSVTNCTFAGEGDAGTQWPDTITVEGGQTTVTVSGNTFARGRGPAVNILQSASLGRGGTGCFITGNVIDCTVDNGTTSSGSEPYAKIEVQAGASGNTVTGNTIIPAGTSGYAVDLFGSNNTVTGNTLHAGDSGYIASSGAANTTSPNTLK